MHLGIRSLGWSLDWALFRDHLQKRYGVTTACLFLGYVRRNEALYESLNRSGYRLIFKPVIPLGHGQQKGNVDGVRSKLERPKRQKAP